MRIQPPIGLLVVTLAALAMPMAATAEAKNEVPRLLHGPVVLRFKAQPYSANDYAGYDTRYVVVALMTTVNLGSSDIDELGGPKTAGLVNIGDIELDGVSEYGYTSVRRRDKCLVAFVGKDETPKSDLKKLDAVPIGGHVRVRIRPLVTGEPHLKYGSSYHRTVTVRQGGSYKLNDRLTQRQLRRIGCNTR